MFTKISTLYKLPTSNGMDSSKSKIQLIKSLIDGGHEDMRGSGAFNHAKILSATEVNLSKVVGGTTRITNNQDDENNEDEDEQFDSVSTFSEKSGKVNQVKMRDGKKKIN